MGTHSGRITPHQTSDWQFANVDEFQKWERQQENRRHITNMCKAIFWVCFFAVFFTFLMVAPKLF